MTNRHTGRLIITNGFIQQPIEAQLAHLDRLTANNHGQTAEQHRQMLVADPRTTDENRTIIERHEPATATVELPTGAASDLMGPIRAFFFWLSALLVLISGVLLTPETLLVFAPIPIGIFLARNESNEPILSTVFTIIGCFLALVPVVILVGLITAIVDAEDLSEVAAIVGGTLGAIVAGGIFLAFLYVCHMAASYGQGMTGRCRCHDAYFNDPNTWTEAYIEGRTGFTNDSHPCRCR